MSTLTMFTGQALMTKSDDVTKTTTIKSIIVANTSKDAETLFRSSLIYTYYDIPNTAFTNFEIVAIIMDKPRCYML